MEKHQNVLVQTEPKTNLRSHLGNRDARAKHHVHRNPHTVSCLVGSAPLRSGMLLARIPVGSLGVFCAGVDRKRKLVTELPIEVRHECVGRHWGDATRLAIVLTLFCAPYLTSAQSSVREEYRTRRAISQRSPALLSGRRTHFLPRTLHSWSVFSVISVLARPSRNSPAVHRRTAGGSTSDGHTRMTT